MNKSELLSLAAWHQAMADEPKRAEAKRKKHAATATILRKLADQLPEELPKMKYTNPYHVQRKFSEHDDPLL